VSKHQGQYMLCYYIIHIYTYIYMCLLVTV